MNMPQEPTLDVRTVWGQLLSQQTAAEGTNRSGLIELWARSVQPGSSSSNSANRSRQRSSS